MTLEEIQQQILPLFEHLTSLTSSGHEATDERLRDVGKLPRGTLFSCFHVEHLKEATKLYKILYKAHNFADFIHLAHEARDKVNEGLFVYAASVAILHRDDCQGVRVPPIEEIFPDRFIPAETVNQAIKADFKRHGAEEEVVVKIQEIGNILDPENKLSYFREDVGANAHHWHWHIVYPATWDSSFMGNVKDRKGELFYYMHQQMCARYDCDRLSTGLRRMIPFHNFDEKLEGYSPHLTSLVSGLNYASRPAGLCLHDLVDFVDVQDMARWRERLIYTIDIGHVIDHDGKEIPLDSDHGIDILGALLESSHDSLNHDYYGNLHNSGHVMMARIHDPDGRFRENPGVMSDASTSLRDPIFYRYHRFIDNMFQEYKATLPCYEKKDLEFPGVELVNVTINSVPPKTPNVVHTFMKEATLKLSHGIRLQGPVKVQYEHLDHDTFTYSISVENKTGEVKHATVRIFLGPTQDELGNKLKLNEQRRFYIELDKFRAELAVGKNTIVRKSEDSSVTISHIPTFDELKRGEGLDAHEFCSCGWPRHLLVPKGTHKGMEYQLFVMLTDSDHDSVGGPESPVCSDAASYCGAKDSKYPDKRAMGFPFDRVIKAHSTDEFKSSNMSFTDVKIQFKDKKGDD